MVVDEHGMIALVAQLFSLARRDARRGDVDAILFLQHQIEDSTDINPGDDDELSKVVRVYSRRKAP